MIARATLGAVLIALCLIVVWRMFRFNTFAADTCADRPAATRHHRRPTASFATRCTSMYVGALLMFVGTHLLLGSRWGLLFVPVGAIDIRSLIVSLEPP
jgi:hypothetical protein